MEIQEKQAFLRDFGNRIRLLRTSQQMSLDELARKCGYTSENARSSIQKIEAGKSDIPASKIRQIANALNTTEAVLMGWEKDDRLNSEQIAQKIDMPDMIQIIKHKTNEATGQAVESYLQLDTEDQAEIRGEMKQMLKSGKYKQDGLKNA